MSLEDIKARAEKATPGPWQGGPGVNPGETPFVQSLNYAGDGSPNFCMVAEDIDLPDADFIANARTDIPKLVAALEAVLELHFRMPGGSCAGCFTNYGEREEHWPCDTVSSITEALA